MSMASTYNLKMRPPEYWVCVNDFTLSIFYTTHLCCTNDIRNFECSILYFHLITQLKLVVVSTAFSSSDKFKTYASTISCIINLILRGNFYIFGCVWFNGNAFLSIKSFQGKLFSRKWKCIQAIWLPRNSFYGKSIPMFGLWIILRKIWNALQIQHLHCLDKPVTVQK